MRNKPLIIQVAGHNYSTDTPTVSRKALTDKLYNELRKKYNFVRLVDLFNLNQNIASSVALHDITQEMYKDNNLDMVRFNRILKLMSSRLRILMMSFKTDRIIVVDNSIYDFILDLTIKYIASFRPMYDNKAMTYMMLSHLINPAYNPFLITFKESVNSLYCDLLINYTDICNDAIVKPKGEFTDELLQDAYASLYQLSINISNDKTMDYISNNNTMHMTSIFYTSPEERINEFVDKILLKIDDMMKGNK